MFGWPLLGKEGMNPHHSHLRAGQMISWISFPILPISWGYPNKNFTSQSSTWFTSKIILSTGHLLFQGLIFSGSTHLKHPGVVEDKQQQKPTKLPCHGGMLRFPGPRCWPPWLNVSQVGRISGYPCDRWPYGVTRGPYKMTLRNGELRLQPLYTLLINGLVRTHLVVMRLLVELFREVKNKKQVTIFLSDAESLTS